MTAVAEPWLGIVGIGDDGVAGLSSPARDLLDHADILVGGARHLAMLGDDRRQKIPWPSPLLTAIDTLTELRGRKVCVLATGDPMWFGIGATLARYFPATEMAVVPAPSAFSLAAARLGWPLADVVTLTLHGRPVDGVRAHLFPRVRLLVLANDADTPAEVAAILKERGFGQSRMVALSHMGGEQESILEATAADWTDRPADFHTLAVECRAGADAVFYSPSGGLPDTAFHNDGTMTKRDVRAATLARLMPTPGARLIDVGAGCGSVSIEWMRAAQNAKAIAIESRHDRLAMIKDNARALGVPDLEVRSGTADTELDTCPDADAVFLGGGLDTPNLVVRSLARLTPGGRLVANAVTVKSEAMLMDAWAAHGGELIRHQTCTLDRLGDHHGWRPMRPVTQWAMVKS